MMNLANRLSRIDRLITARETPRPVLTYSDPLYFAVHALGFQPDDWQADVLRWHGTKLLLNCCRQSGKSTLSAILAAHRAIYYAKSLILCVSPTLRQSSELFRKVSDFLNVLPVRPALVEDNRLSCTLKNGSRIVSLPSKEGTVRGYSSPSLIIEDESARVHDDVHLAVRPMLAVSRGQHILMSTPFGKRGHFYEAWEHDASWTKVRVTAEQCPRISADFLASERRVMPHAWYAAEYGCEFTEAVDAVFAEADIDAALCHNLPPLDFGLPYDTTT